MIFLLLITCLFHPHLPQLLAAKPAKQTILFRSTATKALESNFNVTSSGTLFPVLITSLCTYSFPAALVDANLLQSGAQRSPSYLHDVALLAPPGGPVTAEFELLD